MMLSSNSLASRAARFRDEPIPMLIFLSAGLLASVATAAAPTPQSGWSQNFDEAQKQALETKRDLLVEFSGSDWCPWCKKIEADVFGRSEFVQRASEQYVLVQVDLPRSPQVIAKVPDFDRNQMLAAEYRIGSFPTVSLMTPGGEVYARTGYQAGGVDAYWKHLEQLRGKFRADHVRALELIAKFDAAQAEERAELARQALALYPKLPKTSSLLRPLVPVLGHWETLDANNKAGQWAKALTLFLPDGYASRAQIEAGQQLDTDNALGVLELAVFADSLTVHNKEGRRRVANAIVALDKLGPIRDERAAAALYANGCLWTANTLGDLARAKDLGHKALEHIKDDAQLEAQVRKVLRKQ